MVKIYSIFSFLFFLQKYEIKLSEFDNIFVDYMHQI